MTTMPLHYKRPFDWDHLFGFLSRRAVHGVEWCDDGTYRRTMAIGRAKGILRVSHDARRHAVTVEFPVAFAGKRAEIERRVRALFDLDHDPAALAAALGRDALLGPILKEHPGIRVPGAWDGFEIAVRAVVGQQISVAAARGLLGTIAEKAGERVSEARGEARAILFPDAERFAEAGLRDGMPASRLATLHALAEQVACGELELHGQAPLEETVAKLRAIRGIGDWTAGYVAMRALGATDAFPVGDLVLRKAAGGLTTRELSARAEAWRPWRAYASMLLWSR